MENEITFCIDKRVKRGFDTAIDDVNNHDDDRLYIIDGATGTGKSVAAMQWAYYVDKTFNIDRVCFNILQFSRQVKACKRGQSIVFDEAKEGLSWMDATTKEGKMITSLLMECRQKGLFLFLCIPDATMFAKYFTTHRANALFHFFKSQIKGIEYKDGKERYRKGRYWFWTKKKLPELFIKAKKLRTYRGVRMSGRGCTGNTYVVPEDQYRKVKAESLNIKIDYIIAELSKSKDKKPSRRRGDAADKKEVDNDGL